MSRYRIVKRVYKRFIPEPHEYTVYTVQVQCGDHWMMISTPTDRLGEARTTMEQIRKAEGFYEVVYEDPEKTVASNG